MRFAEGEFYHIYNRGNGKNPIFLTEKDYERFMKLLYVCNSVRNFNFRDSIILQKIDAWDFDRGKTLVDIGAWVLMPNHFHILLTSPRSDLGEKGRNPYTEFMRKLSTAYAMYFNKTHNRTGSLFEGKFKSKHIGEGKESYFNYLFSYIHLNPIKLIQSDWKEQGIQDTKKALEYIKKFPYSSYNDYSGLNRGEGKIINKDFFNSILSSNLEEDIFHWIKNSEPKQ